MYAQRIFKSAGAFAECDQILGVFWILKKAEFLHEDDENISPRARMCRLIGVFVGHTSLEMERYIHNIFD